MIRYTVELYFEKFKNVVRNKKEIEIREFLFTSDEIDEDWQNYEKIRGLKHVLKPIASVASMVSLEDNHYKEDGNKLKAALKS